MGMMTRAMIALTICFGGLMACVSASCHMGSCPNPPVQKDFNIERYMGKWFEYVKFPWRLSGGARCTTANYTLNPDGSVVVLNGGIREVSYGFGICPWYESDVAKGEATIKDQKEPAKLTVRFRPNVPAGSYWVLETDYVTYSVVYNCEQTISDYVPVFTEIAWVLTRERGVAPPNLVQIYGRLKDQGINPETFELTDHKGCPVWPKE